MRTRTRATDQARPRAANDNANGGAYPHHQGGAYDRDSHPRREFYTDPQSLLHFIDSRRFARACAGREPTAKMSKSHFIAWETGKYLYGAVLSLLNPTEKDLYRRYGLACAYSDVHRVSRKILIPLIDQLLSERRVHAIVPAPIVEMLADTIRERLWREHGNIKRVA